MPPSAAPEWLRTGWILESSATSAPASNASIAARIPAQPAPTMRTSCLASTTEEATQWARAKAAARTGAAASCRTFRGSVTANYGGADEPDGQNQSLSTDDGARWAEVQDEYIAGQEMVLVDGYIGNDPEFRTATRLFVEAANANIAGMQKQLYFGPAEADFEPELTV